MATKKKADEKKVMEVEEVTPEVKPDIPDVDKATPQKAKDNKADTVKAAPADTSPVIPNIEIKDGNDLKMREATPEEAKELLAEIEPEVKVEGHRTFQELEQKLIDVTYGLVERISANDFNAIGINEGQINTFNLALKAYNSIKTVEVRDK